MGSATDCLVDVLGRGPSGMAAGPSPRVAVVIPAFNESATIRDVVARALRHAERVIVVDDGSDDGTGAALHGVPATVLRNASNLGKAASLRRGMARALVDGATAVVTLDADGQHEPEDIPRLVAAHLRNPRSIVIGARMHGREAVPRSRYFANRFADFWIGWAAGYRMSDSQSGFRLYPATLLCAIGVHNDQSQRFVFESAVLINAARAGVESVAVGISAIYHSGARASHFRPVVDVLLITRMVAWKLLTRGFNIPGLIRSLRYPDRVHQSHMA
jgi:glycosyltransferase involved in cell wall biosynthesis